MRKMRAQSFTEEALKPTNEELLYEQESASQRCGKNAVVTAKRLIFFASPPGSARWDDKVNLPTDHALGYAILVYLTLPDNTIRTYLLEAIVRRPSVYDTSNGEFSVRPVTNYFVHCAREWVTALGPKGAREIAIVGSYFTQQNNLTHVCAHAALRMAMNSTPVFGLDKLTNQKINAILDLDFTKPVNHIGRYKSGEALIREPGLNNKEMCKVIEMLGATVIQADFLRNSSVEFDHYTYPFMESGFPVIVGLDGFDPAKGKRIQHVVTILGHTLNSDRWSPEARAGYGMLPRLPYIPAAEWTDHFIINDDGYGMYETLQADAVRNILVPSKNTSLHAVFAMGVTPKVTVAGLTAETVAMITVQHLLKNESKGGYWFKKLHGQNLVARTLVQTREDYRNHLKSILDSASVSSITHLRHLDLLSDSIWVTEITLPHLYTSNGRKLGDVVIQADVAAKAPPETAFDAVQFVWLPGAFSREGRTLIFDWPIIDHVPLIERTNVPPYERW